MCNNSLQVCCQLVSACYTAGGELERLTLKCCAFSQLFTTIVSNQEESSVLVQAFDALHTLADNGMYQFTLELLYSNCSMSDICLNELLCVNFYEEIMLVLFW